ncbi:MAG: hypothetical protein SGJ19_21565 [Planctomycetia bacterium]|nr:hypothetical protein [Planctomycetia bacterium]
MKSDRAPQNARRQPNAAARDGARDAAEASSRSRAPMARPIWLLVSGVCLASWLAVLGWLAWRG